jgi:hypothetical protein
MIELCRQSTDLLKGFHDGASAEEQKAIDKISTTVRSEGWRVNAFLVRCPGSDTLQFQDEIARMRPGTALSVSDTDSYGSLESRETSVVYQESGLREAFPHPLPVHGVPISAPMITNNANIGDTSYGTYNEVIPGANFGPWDASFWMDDSSYTQRP